MMPGVSAEYAGNSKIDVAHLAVGHDHQVGGVQIRMKHAVLKGIAQEVVDQVGCKSVGIEGDRFETMQGDNISRFPRAHVVKHGKRFEEFGGQDTFRGVLP